MGRLPTALPGTMRAAGHARQYLSADDPRRADIAELLATLADLDAVHSGGAGVPLTLLRRLVITTADLAGHRWIAAFGDNEAVTALTGLRTSSEPPALPVLDQILGGVLRRRFARAQPGTW